jgi:predicted GH43/DUF377 family glycosyl hydrolase
MKVKTRLTLDGSTAALIVLTVLLLLAFLLISKPTQAVGPIFVVPGEPLCTLTKYSGNPVLSAGPSGSWDDAHVFKPVVLKDGEGYKMWYRGNDGSNPDRIGLATSADGIDWTKHPGNPVISPIEAWETNSITPGAVISNTGTYEMWYTGYDSNWVGRIGYATSPDGVNWTKYGGNPVLNVGASDSWEDEDVAGPAVLEDGGIYHMWYAANDGIASRIGHVTSANGTSWTRDPANPVLDIGPSGNWDWLNVYYPNAVKVGDEYQLWYSGSTLPSAWQSGYATSADGSNWTRQQMIIPQGPVAAFDADSADYVSVLVDGATTRIWYSGHDGDKYTIGYASAAVCDQNVYLPSVTTSGSSCTPYYVDDFSDSNSGWYISDNPQRSYKYIEDQYEIFVKQPSLGWSTTPGALATDFSAQVTARRLNGNGGGYGLAFAISEGWDDYYLFLIDFDQYSVWRLQNGSWYEIKSWTHSSYVNTGTSWNKMKVVRDGNAIIAYINDHRVGDFLDNNITGLGRIGLHADTWSAGSSQKARFDDFSLSTAACGLR